MCYHKVAVLVLAFLAFLDVTHGEFWVQGSDITCYFASYILKLSSYKVICIF